MRYYVKGSAARLRRHFTADAGAAHVDTTLSLVIIRLISLLSSNIVTKATTSKHRIALSISSLASLLVHRFRTVLRTSC